MWKRIEPSRAIVVLMAFFVIVVPLSAGALILSEADGTIRNIYFKQHSLEIKVGDGSMVSTPFGLAANCGICLSLPDGVRQLKGMRAPEDILFISKDERIVDFLEAFSPSDLGHEWASQKKGVPAQYILIVRAGFIKKNQIGLGEPVALL